MVAQFRRARKGGVSVTFGQAETPHPPAHPRRDARAARPGGDHVRRPARRRRSASAPSTTAPTDPALARLFPDGYTDDPEASADFRRYTETGLRDAKRAAARTALESIGEPGQRHVLDLETAQAWLRALNDTRLVLGERLGVTEDLDELIASLEEDDPRLGMFWVYDRLTYLQDVASVPARSSR